MVNIYYNCWDKLLILDIMFIKIKNNVYKLIKLDKDILNN